MMQIRSITFIKNTWITCVICFSFLMCGCSRVFTSFLLDQLRQEESFIKPTQNEASWLCSLSSLSNPVGFLLSGYTMDTLGRKWSIKCVFMPFIIGWAIISPAQNLKNLYLGTALHGIASGMSMTASIYISEVSSTKYRQFFLSLLGLSYMLGTMVGSVLHCTMSWRYVATLFLVISLFMLATTIYTIPESPYWLILKGYIGEATTVLESIRDHDDIVKQEILDIEECVQRKENTFSGDSNPIAALLAARKQLSILTALAVLHKLTGFTPLAQYTVTFFQELHIPIDGKQASLVHSVVCFVSTFSVPYFVHNYDKKPLLFVTSIAAGLGMTATLLYEYVFYDRVTKPYFWIPLVGVYAYDVATTVGITSILVMLPGELLPTEISGIACTVFSITCSLITTIVVKTYLTLFSYIGLLWMLWTFVVCCFCIAYVSVAILPETRGKSLHEIQKVYLDNEYHTNTEIKINITIETYAPRCKPLGK